MSKTHLKTVTELFGLPDPPKTGRERLVAAAIDLFYRQGFGAVGVDQVIAKAGVTKTTFYKHFESKDDLMVAAVQRRDEWESAAWQRAAQTLAGDDPAEQLLALFDVMDQWFNQPEFNGCMFMNAAAEFPNPYDPVHQAAMTHRRRMGAYFADLARKAGASEASADEFAACFTLLVEGAFMLRHTHGRNDAARVIRPSVEELVSRYLPRKTPSAKPSKRRSVVR